MCVCNLPLPAFCVLPGKEEPSRLRKAGAKRGVGHELIRLCHAMCAQHPSGVTVPPPLK